MQKTAGTQLHIANAAVGPNVDSVAEFEALTYLEVQGVTDLGEWGVSAEEITGIRVTDTHVRRIKGALDGGVIEIVCDRIALNLGQVALINAANDSTEAEYGFRVTLKDMDPTLGTPTIYYWKGPVLGFRNTFGQNTTVAKVTFRLGVNGAIYEDPAAFT